LLPAFMNIAFTHLGGRTDVKEEFEQSPLQQTEEELAPKSNNIPKSLRKVVKECLQSSAELAAGFYWA